MTTPSPSAPTKPQSIVHKIGRVGSVIALPFAKQGSKRKLKARLSKFAKELYEESELSEHTAELTERDDSTHDSLGECSLTCEDIRETTPQNGTEKDIFIPVDQNEFLVECFMTHGHSDMTFIVHFYDEDSATAESVEECILVRSMEAGSNCQLRRVNARLAPLFTSKLGIDAEQSTVVAIRNGTVINKISDISSAGCWELEKWITDTGVLEKKHAEFQSLHTLSC